MSPSPSYSPLTQRTNQQLLAAWADIQRGYAQAYDDATCTYYAYLVDAYREALKARGLLS